MRKPPFYWLLTPWIFAAVLAITIIGGFVTGADVSDLIMIIIGFAMFTGWAFLLLRMVDLGGYRPCSSCGTDPALVPEFPDNS